VPLEKDIVVTISQDQLENLESLEQLLISEGLHITNRFAFGVITGKTEEKNFENLRNISGVISLKEEPRLNISPPDSEIQ
jgi:hypothetical protein